MKKLPIIVFILVLVFVFSWFTYLLTTVDLEVLNAKGIIAQKQSYLIIYSMALMLAIAIPVILIGYIVAFKYRAGNKKSKYLPDWTGNNYIKFGYWGFFISLAFLFFVVIWISTHDLDPYKPIPSENEEITIQVVALNWKWLFIYPEENIASVNFMQIPIDTPIRFELTADAPMNSFWIPQLSGQIYSMSAMSTKLHIRADEIGDFEGGAAEINGRGFSGMRFITRVSSEEEFNDWVKEVRSNSNALTLGEYNLLKEPSEYDPAVTYSSVEENLFNDIMMKYMVPNDEMDSMNQGGVHSK